jgi:drug/metabolite transporter (DMT)-like permease
MQYSGEIAALATAVCWTITSAAFEHTGKKIGSLNLNLLRLVIGMTFLSLFTWITRGYILPFDASGKAWFWLSISGFVGIVLGDLFLFEAFVRIGARISMLIYSSVPPLSALLAYLFLGESMSFQQLLGMTITLIGISMVILISGDEKNKVKLAHPIVGILLAFGGAIGQAAGYIIGKYGMADYDPFAATQIRLIAGLISFSILFIFKKQWGSFFKAFKHRSAMKAVTIGSFFGPFIGISLSLYAVQQINPGVASTLISITPVLLIPYAILIKKETIVPREILGSFIAIAGVALMFL